MLRVGGLALTLGKREGEGVQRRGLKWRGLQHSQTHVIHLKPDTRRHFKRQLDPQKQSEMHYAP